MANKTWESGTIGRRCCARRWSRASERASRARISVRIARGTRGAGGVQGHRGAGSGVGAVVGGSRHAAVGRGEGGGAIVWRMVCSGALSQRVGAPQASASALAGLGMTRAGVALIACEQANNLRAGDPLRASLSRFIHRNGWRRFIGRRICAQQLTVWAVRVRTEYEQCSAALLRPCLCSVGWGVLRVAVGTAYLLHIL